MKTSALIFCVIFLAASASAQWKYPPTKTGDASDTYFGKTYKDPYRWLENLKDKDVETWFKAQADLTESALARIPGRKALVDEWLALDNLKSVNYSGIVFMNGRVFYKKTRAGENVGIVYYREGIKGEEKLLFDPGTYSKEQKTVVQTCLPSWNGKRVLLGLSAGGAEWSELRVLDVDSRKLLPETIYPSFAAYMWAPDNGSFLYDAGKVTDIKSVEIELNRKVRVHKLGSAISDDIDLLSNESQPALGIAPREIPGISIDMDCPDYVFAQVGTVQRETRLFDAPTSEMRSGKMNWKVLCKLSDNLINYVVQGDFIYAETHAGAPKYKVVRTTLKNPDWNHAEMVIPEAADAILYITKSKHFLFVVYSNGIVSRIVKYDFGSGKTSEVKLPITGTAFISCPDWTSDLCHVAMTSWTLPLTRYDYDPQNETFAKSLFNEDVIYPGFENLVAEEVEVPSHDGVMVPLSIVHQKQMKLDGSNCCILEGYGAYGMTYPANCGVMHSVATHGVVLAFAHPRGGGEKGEAWYKAGYKATKPNTWKDFIACAEYLVKKGYTSPEKLGGTGTSAGGILISRAITERPDLFRAAICNVGCANIMRGEFTPNGPVNTPEFGTVQDEAECKALFEMDGVAHVRAGVKYPAVMGVGGWNDPRVSPWQPGKFVAALQNATASDRPVFMKVNYDNGHFTEEKVVTFKNFASQTSFLLWQTGHKEFQPVQ